MSGGPEGPSLLEHWCPKCLETWKCEAAARGLSCELGREITHNVCPREVA